MRVIVIGGTGATGSALIAELLQDDAFTEVVSLVRNPSKKEHPKLTEVKVDFDKLTSYSDLIHGDIAFTCLGTTKKDAGGKAAQWKVDYDYNYEFASLCKQNNIKTFVLLSAQNADPDSIFFYSKMKGTLEKAIEKLAFKHLIINRPSILIRPNSQRTGEKIGVHIIKFLNRIGLFKKYKALPVDEVAKTLVIAAKRAQHL